MGVGDGWLGGAAGEFDHGAGLPSGGARSAVLLPPDMKGWLPEDHFVWFLLAVVDHLDVSAFERNRRRGGVGRRGFDPRMLLALLVYAYAGGQRSSRRIEDLCVIDVAFRVICAQDVPDHSTIARFRQDNTAAVESLFVQVLELAGEAGLGRVGPGRDGRAGRDPVGGERVVSG